MRLKSASAGPMTSAGVEPSKRSIVMPARSALFTYWRCLRFSPDFSASEPGARSMTRVVGGWTLGAARHGAASMLRPYGDSGRASGSARTVAIRSPRPSLRSAETRAACTSGSSSAPMGPRGAYARCQPSSGIRRSRSWTPATGSSRVTPIARRTGRQPAMARTSPHSQSWGKAWYGADSTNRFHAVASVSRHARSWLSLISPILPHATHRVRRRHHPMHGSRCRRSCSARGPCRRAG